jgi:phosphate starvation-inducible protein PhoH
MAKPKTDVSANLQMWKKGQSGNPAGRPKKIVSILGQQGYKLSQVNDTIQIMLMMTIKELKVIFDNPDATILEKTIAGAMVNSLKKGSLYSVETLLTRIYGKPKETSTVTNDGKIEFVITKGKTIL